MTFETGKTYSGFTLNEKRELAEINSTALIFSHEKTGARLLKLQNADDNRVFSICFRTPPNDDTGLPHILEHSVLTGSRKFPTKEPFVEMMKSSLNTFLNAMTYPDKTMYPVASKNERDFFNLMDVYLDAVFHPNIYDNPFILMQEGWHYETDNPEGSITYSGVVFNEMKGAFSSPERMLYSYLQRRLLPDTIYGFESGGDPAAIPTLTRDSFLDFHRRYYHPSNSYIYLYGNGDTDEELSFIDNEYLGDFTRLEVHSIITPQMPFTAMRDHLFEYPVSAGEPTGEKSYLGVAFCSGVSLDPLQHLIIEIIKRILVGTPASPLRKALLKAGIGKDIMGIAENELLQLFLCIIVKDTDPERKDEFLRIVHDTLESQVKNGIDPVLAEASVNYIEFQLREAEIPRLPKGLFYHMRSMNSWLYGDDPLIHLNFEPTLAAIRKGMKEGLFEDFISRHLLGNPHAVTVILKPKPGLAGEMERETQKRLDAYKSSLSPEALESLIAENRELKERQARPDSPEDLAKLPALSLPDISRKNEELKRDLSEIEGIPTILVDVPTSGITYLNLHFDISGVEQELLPYLGLLSGLLGKISTASRDYSDLANLINLHTGGLSFVTETYPANGSPDEYHPRFTVRSKALDNRVPRLLDIIGEIASETDFSNLERVREVVKEIKSRYEMGMTDQGHIVAQKRLLSYFSPMDYFDDLVSGFSFYRFIAALEKNLEKDFDTIRENLIRVRNAVFNPARLLTGITSQADGRRHFKEGLKPLVDRLPRFESPDIRFDFPLENRNEGLMLSQSQVHYVAKGYNFLREGYSFKGSMHVLGVIVRLDYLWNRVRVKGGAYGAMASIQRNGNFSFSSYRDPNLSGTLSVYRETPSYLRSFSPGEREMEKYIIGAISALDQHLTPRQKGDKAARLYISGISDELLQKEREDVLGATLKDITGCADMLESLMKKDYHCVLGSETKIKEESGIFKNIINVME